MNIETSIISLIVQVTATNMIIPVSIVLVIDVQKSNIRGPLHYNTAMNILGIAHHWPFILLQLQKYWEEIQ